MVMKRINRRNFIKAGAIGVAGMSVLQPGLANMNPDVRTNVLVDKVKLGNSGLTVSRIAMGTGTKGYNRSSNQTRKGMEHFKTLALHAYERGIRFYDSADGYGSMPFVGESIKTLPRENLTLLTKIWIPEDDANDKISLPEILDRFRKELGTDYIDILLIHYMTQGGWATKRKRYMDDLSKAKQDGIVKALGVSCHNIDALRDAAASPWVDVIMARINPFGTNMDDTPDAVKNVLATAKGNGKGVVGMKIFGEGVHVKDEEREQSIRFALKEGNIHCMTLGLESIEQMDDAIKRVMNNC